jgi:hypothetical protein
MRWNIDKSLAALEVGQSVPGTALQRVLMDAAIMIQEGLKPKSEHLERGHGFVWCLSIGLAYERKFFFHGHTIREAYLRARKGLGLTKKGRKKCPSRKERHDPSK